MSAPWRSKDVKPSRQLPDAKDDAQGKERLTGGSAMPLAYARGAADFYGRDFAVTPAVLIPRPETEQLIDLVLSLAGKPYLPGVKPGERVLPANPVILDVGTGSGCIAVTLALELPEAEVLASDISPAAIEVAQKNAAKYDAPISFVISHLMEKVNSKPDLVVANLPYVDEHWDWLDRERLSYEPDTALYAPDGGLALIKELIREANAMQILRLVLEADPCQHARIEDFAREQGYHPEKTMGYALSLAR